MTQPQVIITELDGALGVLPPSAGRLTAFVGVSTAGPVDTPATYARTTNLVTDFGEGPNVEAAGYYITTTGRPAVIVRAAASGPSAVSAVTSVATGTAIVTVSATANQPVDDFEYVLKVIKAGTIGTAGIVLRVSVDGGYNYGPELPLDTAVKLAVGAVEFEFAAGTMVVGDLHMATATAPTPDAATLKTALDALGASAVQWEQVVITAPLLPTTFDTVELAVASYRGRGRYRSWLGTVRMGPSGTESEATYLSSLATAFAPKQTIHGALCAGAVRLTSGVSGLKYRRPLLFGFVGHQCNVSEEINVADVNLGPLVAASITDTNGNPIEHDESLNPGLDDARFVTARSWDGYPGVYVNRPRVFSNATSDFQIVPYRRVLNLAEAVLREYFIRRLNRPVRVDTSTGFILEADALEIEGGALQAMRSSLLAKPKASDVQFILSRVDNVLSTKTLTGTARVIPLAYPEFIEITVGFYNPALQVAA